MVSRILPMPFKYDYDKILKMHLSGMTILQIAKELDASVSSIRDVVNTAKNRYRIEQNEKRMGENNGMVIKIDK